MSIVFLLALLGLGLGGVAAKCQYQLDGVAVEVVPDDDGHVVVPDGVTRIGPKDFENCVSMVSITLPNSVTSIRSQAFLGCTSLLSITLPPGVTHVGEWAFKGCTSLAAASLPDGLKTMGPQAFYGTRLTEADVTLPASFDGSSQYLDNRPDWYYYNCMGYTDITLPDGLTSLGARAFRSCENLRSIILPESLLIVDTLAFAGCTSLLSINLPEGVQSIGISAFQDCDSLLSIDLPSSVNTIMDTAFYSCDKLESAILPAGVTSIGKWAFENCFKLGLVYVPEGCSLGERAFDHTGGGYVYGRAPPAPPQPGDQRGVADVSSDQSALDDEAVVGLAVGVTLFACCSFCVLCACLCLYYRNRLREDRQSRPTKQPTKAESRATWHIKTPRV